jgi:hypothetical protein
MDFILLFPRVSHNLKYFETTDETTHARFHFRIL